MGPIKSLTVMPNKVGTRQGRPASRFVWIPLSFVLLGLARVALLTIPFKRIAPLLGHDMQSAAMVPLAAPKEISRESKCLAQAMVARVLLGVNDLPYALYLGVNTGDEGGLTAHAWVCVGPEALVGGQAFSEYTVVGTFVSDKLLQS